MPNLKVVNDNDMPWNLENIRFLYPPDDFLGKFDNEKMQERHEAAQKVKIDHILVGMKETKDPISAMNLLHKRSHIPFLLNNIDLFIEAACFEQTVLQLYYRKNTPFIGTDDLPTWAKLFKLCNSETLDSIGKPLPQSEITVYRGSVTGNSKGLSWTISKEKADWFLNRWQDKDMGGGTVYAMQISRDDIIIHYVDDEKQEIILKPERLDSIQPVIIESI